MYAFIVPPQWVVGCPEKLIRLLGASASQQNYLSSINMIKSTATTNGILPDDSPLNILPNGRLRDEYYKPYPPNHFAPKPGHQKLDIAIIGAGIAGLLTAVALVQSGHNVEVTTLRGH